MGLFDNFHLFFKATPEAEAEAIEFEDMPREERRRKKRKNPREGTRVLVIDDSSTITNAIKRVLRSIGCSVEEAFDAETGLRLVLSYKPELIFLDIVLPGINGFSALRALRRDARTQHIPIIMMSGNGQMIEQFFKARIGADDFLKKPFARFEIFARIEKLLDENHVPRRIAQAAPAQGRAPVPASTQHAPANAARNNPPPVDANHQAAALLHGGQTAPTASHVMTASHLTASQVMAETPSPLQTEDTEAESTPFPPLVYTA
jgi:twitching motility two-component system response regulator PilH